MANAAACGINFQNVRPFIGRVQNRLGAKLYNNSFRDHPRGEENSVLQAVSAIFGINEANDSARLGIVDRAILPRLMEPANSKFLHRTIDALPGYAGWTGSGAQRFMPVAAVIGNMLEGRSIFSQEILASLPDETRHYLMSNHPFYSAELSGRDLPQTTIEIPERKTYSWLDIGSAPKSGGAPTLNIINECFPGKFNITGIDISFPLFELSGNGDIVRSRYNSVFGRTKRTSFVEGIRYGNGRALGYNIHRPLFMFGRTFDFVSMCMVLPQIAGRDQHQKMPFTSLAISSESQNFDPMLNMAKIQQRTVDAALRRLAINGIFIGDLRSQLPADMREEERTGENQEGLMFIIRRDSEKEFTIFDQHPIVFNTSPGKYLPSQLMGFINGYKHPKPVFNHEGISACYPELSEQQMQSLGDLFISADWLALRHQSWKKSVWGRVSAVIDGIGKQSPLTRLMEIYLQNVPDCSGEKSRILAEASGIEN